MPASGMLYTLLRLLATKPQLLADHAEGYAELVGEEIASVSTSWKRRAMLYAAALCCLGVAVVLAGVALMLWATTPAASVQAFWVLIATPLAPIVVALGCLLVARTPVEGRPFDNVRRQVAADMALLREVNAS